MIAIKSTECINQAVAYELQNIVKNYGATYNSEHEGYAVLLEETDEASDDLKYIHNCMDLLWKEVKANKVTKDFLYSIKIASLELAKEAVQCAAVCERFEATIENKEDPPTYREDKTIL